MMNRNDTNPRFPRIATAALLAASFALPATAQIEALRNGDDQYIEGLREQGMSDLLERFSETDPPEDPIARLTLDVSLKEFVASSLLTRASEANIEGDFDRANALFVESREAFEDMLAAQRQLIADHPDDERTPIWQTDFAQMLIDEYLPKYFQNVLWHYEYGLPNAEQKEAYESVMIEALTVTLDASNRLSQVPNRVGRDAELRVKLEEMQIWFKLEDYTKINNPYWLAHAAHGVSLFPDSHEYFSAGDVTRGQRPDAASEKTRLRNRVLDEAGGALASDPRTEVIAKLLNGKTLVWSQEINDIDDGVEEFLEPVIEASAAAWQGYLATLGKAVGRWRAGELDVAESILDGMASHRYVQSDGSIESRLLAADLHFRILVEEAQGEPAGIAEAYEKAYIPLIDGDDGRFKSVLFTRWAEGVGEEVDPASLPATVRMGIGEQLTQRGGRAAQIAVNASQQDPPASPTEAQRWRAEVAEQVAQAKALLERAADFNVTLTGDDIDAEALLGRGLFNLGNNQYWIAELDKAVDEDKNIGWQPYLRAGETWLSVAQRVPESEQAERAISFAINLLLPMDIALNKGSVREPSVRAAYRAAFELINERWPQSEAAHNNRLYAGFELYERVGELQQAAEVYNALPRTHRDYYQAKRQMVYALHRSYRSQSDRLRLMVATQPLNTPPDGLTGEQIEAFEANKLAWAREHDALEEGITRMSGMIIEEAELVVLDAASEAENGEQPSQRFAAATALGACRVVLAGMEADAGNTDEAIRMLMGFETVYGPQGKYADLAQLQSNPEAAAATLQGLVQSAQEQRILSLLDAKRTGEMATQAEIMMRQSPDVAAAVINGVLRRVRAEIDREKRAVEAAAFRLQVERAEANIKFFADAAVELGELLVDWAGTQGFDEKQMAAYEMPLAESLMLADRGEEALAIMTPILELYPNTFNILLRTGRAHLSVFAKNGGPADYESAMGHFSKVVQYYNQRKEKPAAYWEAWLSILELMDAAGGDPAATIPKRARMLYGVDENLGGPSFKESFELIIQRNGGVERLQAVPGVTPIDADANDGRPIVPWPETFTSSADQAS